LSDLVEGSVVENDFGRCFVALRRYQMSDLPGCDALVSRSGVSPSGFSSSFPQFHLAGIDDFTGAAFLDTETTGLGTGTGIYCFMVGVATFDVSSENQPGSTCLTLRQFFMRSPAEEAALLSAVKTVLDSAQFLVTFNGRRFDVPLLRTRYTLYLTASGQTDSMPRLISASAPHLDLLYPARRLWRRRLGSCALKNLEEHILGMHRSQDDVPGSQIPALYVEFLRTRDATGISQVFYHNREDVGAMVGLADRLGSVYGRLPDEVDPGLPGPDLLALGVFLENMGRNREAESAYRLALPGLTSERDLSDAFCRLGRMQKRAGRWKEAEETWTRWLTTVSNRNVTPYVELAKYCEWQLRDLDQAEMWTSWALHELNHAVTARSVEIARLEHRLSRLRRKRGVQP
jgi:uncharacterized protein YprB with RNaseH-like and TPR domain